MTNPFIGIEMADGLCRALFGPARHQEQDAHECRIDDGDTEPCEDCPLESCPVHPQTA